MNEKYLLLTNGLKNLVREGRVIGFELQIRIGYYRGVSLAIVKDLSVTADGHSYSGTDLLLTVAGRTFTLDEAAREESVRWEYWSPITVTVLQDGGLEPGAHDISVTQTILPSYMPSFGFASTAAKRLTVCPASPVAASMQLGVSLYSYQEEFYRGAMSLRNCVAEVAAIGATGVQLLPEQMTPGYPNPSPAWVDQWHALMDEFGTTPTVMDTFVDVTRGGHRVMSSQEALDELVGQLRLAKALGFPAVRPTTGPVADAAPELVEAALPYAADLGIRIAPEIHAPVTLGGSLVSSYLDLIDRTGTEFLGFTLDLGVFCTSMPPAMIGYARRRGVTDDIIEFVESSYAKVLPREEIVAGVQHMGGGEAAFDLAMRTGAFGPPSNHPEALAALIPNIVNVHAKFYEVSEDGVEQSIPYREILDVLIAGGYSGSLDSEYEGQRLTQDAYETDSCEQVRRHHMLMRRCLDVLASASPPHTDERPAPYSRGLRGAADPNRDTQSAA